MTVAGSDWSMVKSRTLMQFQYLYPLSIMSALRLFNMMLHVTTGVEEQTMYIAPELARWCIWCSAWGQRLATVCRESWQGNWSDATLYKDCVCTLHIVVWHWSQITWNGNANFKFTISGRSDPNYDIRIRITMMFCARCTISYRGRVVLFVCHRDMCTRIAFGYWSADSTSRRANLSAFKCYVDSGMVFYVSTGRVIVRDVSVNDPT